MGEPIQESYSGAFDGRPYPLTRDPNVSSVAYKRNGNTGQATLTLKDGGTSTADITFSDDGKTMTIATKSGDKSFTEVYDRVGAGQKKAAAKKSM
jgi:hypothetical protein